MATILAKIQEIEAEVHGSKVAVQLRSLCEDGQNAEEQGYCLPSWVVEG